MDTPASPPSVIRAWEARDLRRRMHDGKTAMGANAARHVAQAAREAGVALCPYSCPFCEGDPRWHVGHYPGMKHLRLLARYIRFGADDGAC